MKLSSYESILREFMPKPLQERRDYGTEGMDALEQNAMSLLDKGIKLPMMLELRLRKRLKKSSIIDYPQDSLCPLIWDLKQPPSLKPAIRRKILSSLFNLLTINFRNYKDWVTEVTLTGSIVTNQYNSSTDIDVNVSIDYDVFRKYNLDLTRHISNDLELRKFIRQKVYKLNGEKLAGDHPVKFFVIGKGRRLESDFVYDLLENKWLKSPILVDKSFDPDVEFVGPRYKALQIISSVIPFILETKVHLSDLIRLEEANRDVSNIRETLKSNINELKQIQEKLKRIRKSRFENEEIDLLGYAFSKNWEFNNIVFKYLERYCFNKPLEVLKLLLSNEEKEQLKKLDFVNLKKNVQAIIKRCPKRVQDDRPKSEQQWCLFDSEGEKLLGRHPTKEDALKQERVIQIHKHIK